MGAAVPGEPPAPELSKELKKAMVPPDVASLPIPPAKVDPKKDPKAKVMTIKAITPEAVKKEEKKEKMMAKLPAKTGAAAKLLPESTTEDSKDEKSSSPLLSENDARCYAARYSDLKGAAALTHYATIGVGQGRLGTCAKSLTDYEA